MLKNDHRNRRQSACLWLAGVLAASFWLNPEPCASAADEAAPTAAEKDGCLANLKQLYSAVKAYQKDNQELPNWLSDLVPKYLSDVTLLTCPVCRRTGRAETPPLADPKITCSYLYEFNPLPLGQEAPAAPLRTRREWKLKQIELAGPIVPLIRCRQHDPIVLNVAFDGKIYESPLSWESVMTNRVSTEDLLPSKIFAAPPAEKPIAVARNVTAFVPARDPKLPAHLLDLGPHYNALLTDSWHGGEGNSLSAIPAGTNQMGGVDFDIRGILQLSCKPLASSRFPEQVKGIKVGQKCKRLHFLHSGCYNAPMQDGEQVAVYVVHFANNPARLEIPIVYGRDVRDWHWQQNEPAAPKDLKLVWAGENDDSRKGGHPIRLYLTSWTNLIPDAEIESVDVVSTMNQAGVFLLAITAE